MSLSSALPILFKKKKRLQNSSLERKPKFSCSSHFYLQLSSPNVNSICLPQELNVFWIVYLITCRLVPLFGCTLPFICQLQRSPHRASSLPLLWSFSFLFSILHFIRSLFCCPEVALFPPNVTHFCLGGSIFVSICIRSAIFAFLSLVLHSIPSLICFPGCP